MKGKPVKKPRIYTPKLRATKFAHKGTKRLKTRSQRNNKAIKDAS